MNKWTNIVQCVLASCLSFRVQCQLCKRPTEVSWCICEHCERSLPTLQSDCIQAFQSTTYSQLLALFPYKPPISSFISQMKYHDRLHFAHYFAHLMIKRFKPKTPIDVIIPIPLHPKKQQKRGFNQNIEIAKVISKQLKIKLDRRSCTKIKDTPSQTTLSGSKRKQNIRPEMFHIVNLRGKRILVIEDVITTGTTVKSFVTALLESGVKSVEIWCCCLAQHDTKK